MDRIRPTESGPTDATIEATSPLSDESCARACKIHLVEGSGAELSRETQSLLRGRLRAASMVLCAAFAAFLAWRLFSLAAGVETFTYALGAHIALTVLLGACAFSLCRKCTVSTRILRAKELLVFGFPALFFVMVQHAKTMECVAEHQVMPSIAPPWLLLIFTYALFIPNTWKRAAAVIAPMALAPVLFTGALWASHAHSAAVLQSDISFVVELTLVMLIGGVTSVAGVFIISGLRLQAFEAKQLGQYKLRQLLGAGGMGEVYLAEHQLMKRPCAIKVIKPEKAGDPRVLARFEREVRATARLSHWNTVDIYDYGRTDDGTFYYVMEYLPGMNIGDLVSRYGPLPPERVIHLLRQTCAALREAHEAGLIHRDIKPANIFAAKRGGVYDVAKLLDFGLAKPLADAGSPQITQENTITGSPLFMSPEQATGDSEPDERSDIYALGVVAYYMLTARAPFEHQQAIKVLIAHANESPAPPSELMPEVPDDLELVVMRCLAKNPDDRYQSAAELAAALDDCSAAGGWTANSPPAGGKPMPISAASRKSPPCK